MTRKRTALLTAAPVPCGSCPYRCDVPSGIWAKHEYDKLPSYDGPTWDQQSFAVFMCHQRDGKICAGWLACHDPQELIALRIQRNVDPAVFDYASPVPVFSSGAEARAHGLRDLKNPGARSRKMADGLRRQRRAKRAKNG